MLIPFTFFVGGLALLLFSGDLLTRSSLRLAVLARITPLAAGLTITAFATSMPEAVISVNAALSGLTDILLGNVVGSNISNILLVLGLPAIFVALNMRITHMRRHFAMMMIASMMLFALAIYGEVGFAVGLGFILILLCWVVYAFKINLPLVAEKGEMPVGGRPSGLIATACLVLAGFGLWVGALLTLEGAETIAHAFGISQAVIGLIPLAIGTSLPELATSIAAIWRRHADIAIGNILGSNVINILFVLGISALITPIAIPKAFLWLDLPVMIGAALLLLPFVWQRRPLARLSGLAFIFCYGLYIASLIMLRPYIS